MSKKFSAQRKRAFLDYLAESGNQTISAERAKVSRSWVCLHRKTDPAFDAECREALRQAQDRLKREAKMMLRALRDAGSSFDKLRTSPAPQDDRNFGSQPLDPKWRYQGGHELVVEGTNGRRTQLRRAKLSQWTPRVEQRFLAVLAGTANVKLACREVGLWPPSAYAHRKRFPGFARAWDQAIEIGMCELEAQIVQNVGYLFDRELPEPEAPMRDVRVMDAIRLLRLYEKREAERERGPSRK